MRTVFKKSMPNSNVSGHSKIVFTTLAVIGASLFSACTGATGPQVQNVAVGTGTGQLAAANAQSQTEYRMGSGDKIKVLVYNEEDLSGEFDVAGNGMLAMPLVGEVQAGGLTIPEFQRVLSEKLKKYLKNPQVSAQVLNYRPFYIRGEVKSGGEYPFVNGLVVADAVAKAGGYTYRAVTSYVYIRHANESTERRYSLNDKVSVLPGDNIRVPERVF